MSMLMSSILLENNIEVWTTLAVFCFSNREDRRKDKQDHLSNERTMTSSVEFCACQAQNSTLPQQFLT